MGQISGLARNVIGALIVVLTPSFFAVLYDRLCVLVDADDVVDVSVETLKMPKRFSENA